MWCTEIWLKPVLGEEMSLNIDSIDLIRVIFVCISLAIAIFNATRPLDVKPI